MNNFCSKILYICISISLGCTSAPKNQFNASSENLDIQLQGSLQNIWKTYIKEDYTDSIATDIYIYTNRNEKTQSFGCTDQNFGVNFDSNAHIGICKVNVPRNHSTGDIPIAKDSRASSHDYFKTLSGKSISEDELLNDIAKTNRIPLVFVHGFNVRYQQAVVRAAQIGYDLKYQGPVILFTWPSGSGDSFMDETLINRTYETNSKTAQQSIATFKEFISKLRAKNITINLMVHSMGHQVVIPAITQTSQELTTSGITYANKPIHELILNAPDFEAEAFSPIINDLKKYSDRVTLYCSNSDKAMTASQTMNKNKRLGACTFAENLDTINVSLVDNPGTTDLGHGYYSSRPILSDIYQVLLGFDASQRLFIRKSEPNADEKYYLRP